MHLNHEKPSSSSTPDARTGTHPPHGGGALAPTALHFTVKPSGRALNTTGIFRAPTERDITALLHVQSD